MYTQTFSLCRRPSNSLSEDSHMEKIRLGIRVQMKISPQSCTSALREREVKWGCSSAEVGVMCMAHERGIYCSCETTVADLNMKMLHTPGTQVESLMKVVVTQSL